MSKKEKIIDVNVKFDKLLYDTGKAILIRIGDNEHWLPLKICKKLIVNKKLGGNVSLPAWFYEKLGYDIKIECAEKTIIHHIPEKLCEEIEHDASLFK